MSGVNIASLLTVLWVTDRKGDDDLSGNVTIRALKYPNIPHYEWGVELVEENDQYVICMGQPGRQLLHHTRQKVFTFQDHTVEFYSFEQWFTVSMGIENGAIRQYYCNIAMPVIRDGDTISFVDLDLDYVKKAPDEPWQVIDMVEFHENAKKYHYPQTLMKQAEDGLRELQERVRESQFPFDGKIQSYIKQVISLT